MKKGILILALVSLVAMACQDIPSVKKPENFIPEKKMEQILYEAVLLKSSRGYNLGNLTSKGIDPENYVLDKYDIDSARYAENIAYYTAQLETYTAMNTRIQDRIAALLKVEDSLHKMEKKIEDSLRLKRSRELEKERVAKMKRDSIMGKSITPREHP